MNTQRWRLHLGFISLILVFVLFSIFFRMTNWDLEISQRFFNGKKWPLRYSEPWATLYEITPQIGVTALLISTLLFILSFFTKYLQPYRWHSLFVLGSFAVGCILVVNALFKECYPRPRPCEVQNFRGKYEFVPVGNLGTSGKSFPSGHAATGYFFGFAFFLLYRKHKVWAFSALLFSLFAGTIIGVGRIVQGKHFASDILWSAGMMYIVMAWLYYYVLAIPEREQGTLQTFASRNFQSKLIFVTLWFGIITIVVVVLLTRHRWFHGLLG